MADDGKMNGSCVNLKKIILPFDVDLLLNEKFMLFMMTSIFSVTHNENSILSISLVPPE